MKHKIYIVSNTGVYGGFAVKRLIRRAASAALKAEGVALACEINVLLTSDKGITNLNSEFRGTDGPTDVLSFPACALAPGAPDLRKAERNPKTGRVFLGDMALSLERARAQAKEYGHSAKREIAYLTVHSVLHLLGYDHSDESGMKRQMREREKYIMARI